jgi:hypothetical protein
MIKVIGIFLLMFTTAVAFGQRQERSLVQFSGVVHNADSSGVIVPYVSITNSSWQGQVSLSNYKGYFSFVAHEQDTIRFTSVGYASVTIVIPASVPTKSYTIQVALRPQIVNLPVFHVFPWATTEEFRKEFISMKIADDDLEIARKNVSRSSLEAMRRTLPRDGSENFGFQDFHNSVVNQHSTVNPLLNPFNWGSLIREISEGDKSRGVSSN